MYSPKTAPNGKTYLNVGCGRHVIEGWNNLDLIRDKRVLRWDIRRGLPFPDNSIDYAYSSHLLEHLSPPEAEKLLKEIYRTLNPGGILRLVVPDLEKICREYLRSLDHYRQHPDSRAWFHYQWATVHLLDQLTRTTGGGQMRPLLNSPQADREYLIKQVGDLARINPSAVTTRTFTTSKWKKILSYAATIIRRGSLSSGEKHQWMYDTVSLSNLLSKIGYKTITIQTFDQSKIDDWSNYNLDRSVVIKNNARKPDSLYIESSK